MDTYDNEQGPTEGVRSKLARVRTSASQAIGHVPAIVARTRHGAEQVAEQVVERFPGTLAQARKDAQGAVTKLQTVPDSGLRLLAATSIGLGTGLRLAGASRLATLAGFAPAPILGFAILSRPHPARSQG